MLIGWLDTGLLVECIRLKSIECNRLCGQSGSFLGERIELDDGPGGGSSSGRSVTDKISVRQKKENMMMKEKKDRKRQKKRK